MYKQKLDGTNMKILNIEWLRRQIALVSQEPALFNMTIADNIRYGANYREVTDEEVEEAAKSANIHDFIMSLPQVSILHKHINLISTCIIITYLVLHTSNDEIHFGSIT